jgi:EmrB/QacA subfamily drug resistance transporter
MKRNLNSSSELAPAAEDLASVPLAPSPWRAFALLATTIFVLILDAAIVNVALPSLGTDLGFAPADLSWVFNAYTLAFGGFLLLGGRLADLVGRRRLFMLGLVLFVTASVLGGLAQSALWLVAARVGQGLGAALVAPAALSLVMTIFASGPERNRALGIWGAVAGSGAAAGVILGGVLTDLFGWQAVFFVNVPIGIAAVALAPRLLPESRDTSAGRGFDLLGAATVTVGLAVLVYALVDAADAGWTSAQTLGLGAVAALLLGAFVLVERRAEHPLVPMDFLRNAELRSANIVNVVMAASIMPAFFFVTFYLQSVLGYSPLRAGFAQLTVSLTLVASAGPASKLVTRLGVARPLLIGLPLVAASLLWFSQLPVDGDYWADVFGPMILLGMGAALAFIPLTIGATAPAAEHESGLASGLLNTTQQVGGALGLGILISLATSRTNDLAASGQSAPAAVVEGFDFAFTVGSGIALAGAVLVFVLMRGRPAAVAEPVLVTEEPEPVLVG